jgi:Zn-dependent M16 (insulinase) family peptidase
MRTRLRLLTLAAAFALSCSPRPPLAPTAAPGAAVAPPAGVPAASVDLDTLRADEHVVGFTTRNLYLDGNGRPIGARFVHDATGFTFDYLRIESAPQGYLWVNSLPTSDMGEPHTQEHLLLGKGDRGRRLGGIETMALGESSAFTEQWRTSYHFNTVAGPEAFWTVFAGQLDALLAPDYTDDEIRREVAHYGVTADPDGTLHLEEKGTVYNEMVRAYEQPDSLAWRRSLQLVYGMHHPLAYESGGLPADIRRMTPADIRSFHDHNYHLANMGMIGAFPAAMPLGQVLTRTGDLLGKRAGKKGPVVSIKDAPPPAPAATGTIAIAEYPDQNAQAPGKMWMVWPATRKLDATELELLRLFVDAVAGDESTNLYKRFIDSKTRTLDLGASSVWASVNPEPGAPVWIGLDQVAPGFLDEAGAQKVRAEVLAELTRIAALPAGDAELLALNERVKSRLVQERRDLAKRLNTPPGFGDRGTGSGWMQLMLELEDVAGFEKSLTLAPQLGAIEKLLAAGDNPWKAQLAAWGLLEQPFAVVTRPSPDERARLDRERGERIAAETARLEKRYGAADAAAALARFARDYDAITRKLEDSAAHTPMPPLVSALPMTLDDGLDFHAYQVGGVTAVSSTFAGTTSGTVGIALDLRGVPAELQPYLHLLPVLLTQSGVIVDGKPVPADEVLERQRREILGLRASIRTDVRTGRVELQITGQGIDAEETRRALAWMIRDLTAPDWRPANLPRLRDVVDRAAQELRTVMQGAEEDWVENPRDAYQLQRSPVHAHAASLLTAAHDAHRLRWRLLDPGNAKVRDEAARLLDKLAGVSAGAKLDRARLVGLAGALAKWPVAKPDAALARLVPRAPSAAALALLHEAGKDLSVLVPDLPDGSLASDWSYLCRQMAADLRFGAPRALAALEQLRGLVVRAKAARLHVVGAAETQHAIAPDVEALVAALGPGDALAPVGEGARFIDDRLLAREPGAQQPVFVGLVNPATQSGVFVHEAPAPGYLDASDDALYDYLASNLYAGHGAHALFIKTWAAGLAYSNGMRVSLRSARLTYYAERCPELPQTMRFVIGELTKARPDASIVSYALAGGFASRLAQTYEDRGEAIADDLADGLPPEKVKAFRSALIALSKRADLVAELSKRFALVYARVLPGYTPGWKPAANAVYMVIGPDGQLDAWQKYLAASAGEGAKLWKLYPRDFWLPESAR